MGKTARSLLRSIKWNLWSICFVYYLKSISAIFLTSNESFDRINQILGEANHFHPNIKLVHRVGKSVSFLDVFIESNNGELVIMRAQHYLSTLFAFNEERRLIKLMLLYNGLVFSHLLFFFSDSYPLRYTYARFPIPMIFYLYGLIYWTE
jgi:hypothetical protein